MRTLIFFILIAASVTGCKSQKIPEANPVESNQVINEQKKISYNRVPELAEVSSQSAQLGFEIRSANLSENILNVSVKYGGGCKTHEFKLNVANEISGDTLKLQLLHLTLDDHCKAFVLNEMQFDLRNIDALVKKAGVVTVNDKPVKPAE